MGGLEPGAGLSRKRRVTTEGSIVAQSMFWPILMGEQPLAMDCIQRFDGLAALGPVTHVRFNILPDGGVSRLRLWGKVAA